MASPPPRTPSALATITVVAPPSAFPKETAHDLLQATGRPLRQNAGTRNTLPARGPGLGRAHRLSPGPGTELAAYGLRLPHPLDRLRQRPCVAVSARHGRSL